MDRALTALLEGAIWTTLNEYKNIELILLKGYLCLEVVMDNLLASQTKVRVSDLSFYRKVKVLESINNRKGNLNNQLFEYLFALNKFRNSFAHDFKFDIDDGAIEAWANSVVSVFDGTKFSKFTPRTKIIHAFSFLTNELNKFYFESKSHLK